MKLSSPYLFLIQAGKKLCASAKQIFKSFQSLLFIKNPVEYSKTNPVFRIGFTVLSSANTGYSIGNPESSGVNPVLRIGLPEFSSTNPVFRIGNPEPSSANPEPEIGIPEFSSTNPVLGNVVTVHSRAPTVSVSAFRVLFSIF